MNKYKSNVSLSVGLLVALAASAMLGMPAQANAQCSPLTSGLRTPLGITQSNLDNLIVSETGSPTLHSGRISIVELDGTRRTLLDGLPSAINDVGEPSGPAGVFMRGRTLYVAIGIGDSILPGPFPGVAFENPNPSSPIFSSVLAIHFSASVEKNTNGFTLTFANQQALASGRKVRLSNGGGDKLTVDLIADFPNFTPNPIPPVPGNVRGSNPFDLVVVDDNAYVTDGGQNSVVQVDLATGTFAPLATFPPIPNPLTPPPPVVEAVPTGIRYVDGQLLVTLFRGFPFPVGYSEVRAVDPATGDHTSFITGRTAAIDVLKTKEGSDTEYLVLQFASDAGLTGDGLLLSFETPGDPPDTIADCLVVPTSMTLDKKTSTVYVTDLTGQVVAVAVPLTAIPVVSSKRKPAEIVLTNQDGSSAAGPIASGIPPLLLATDDRATPAKLEQAKKIFEGFQQGKIDRSLFTDLANAYFSEQALEDFKHSLGPLGKWESFNQTGQGLRGGMVSRTYLVRFKDKTIRVWIFEMPDGKLEQFQVTEVGIGS